MNDLDYVEQNRYLLESYGTIGQFSSPAGPLGFLLTKARLGAASTANERRLAGALVPFREVVTTSELSFAQILQRDIDDHRVARQLIPYLLTARDEGPAAFPPILCMLLPFEDNRPVASFPNPEDLELEQDPNGLHFTGRRWGDAFQVQELRTSDGGRFPMAVGRLQWNPEHTQLVVLDGQHRAMALLAVHRTVTNTWDDSPGRRYRVFYEEAVSALLAEVGDFDVESVEIPVSVCWFPEQAQNAEPHQSARQLFVDVNREARPPSTSRTTLLSESDLVSVFTRHVLDKVREVDGNEALPLEAIEYDNPSSETYRPVKWSVLTNLELIKHAVQHAVFGPQRLVEQADSRFSRGPRSTTGMDQFMQAQLQLSEDIGEFIEDGDGVRMTRDEIGNTNFPRRELETLMRLFWDSWGQAIVSMLSDLAPYAAHAEALRKLRDGWQPDDSQGRLAYDAIFESVGVYFTLRSEHAAWVSAGRSAEQRTEAISAWKMLEERQAEFEQLRAGEYLGEGDDDGADSANRLYRTFNTHACQLGAVLAMATLAYNADLDRDEIGVLADRMIAGWNAALEVGDRKHFLDRDADKSLNQIRQMNTPQAVSFRYFWLELLATPEGEAQLDDDERSVLRSIRDDARDAYFYLLEEQELKVLKRRDPQGTGLKHERIASQNARKLLWEALSEWMAVDEEEFTRWFEEEEDEELDDDDEEYEDED